MLVPCNNCSKTSYPPEGGLDLAANRLGWHWVGKFLHALIGSTLWHRKSYSHFTGGSFALGGSVLGFGGTMSKDNTILTL